LGFRDLVIVGISKSTVTHITGSPNHKSAEWLN
jgi:hypothetical protein